MASKLLWSPTNKDTNLKKFQKKNNLNLKDNSYQELHNWSIKNKADFWSSIWDFTEIIGSKNKPIIENENNFIESKFFENSYLNFTENLIHNNKSKDDAVVFYSENKKKRKLSWSDLRKNTNKVSNFFKKINIKNGDRVAAILPNIPETVVSFLVFFKI